MNNEVSSGPVVAVRNVSRSFGGASGVRDLSLELRKGEFFSLLGPSGCGKTTTLRMIAGFERPDRGTVEIMGQDVTHAPPNHRPVNTVFQNYALFAHLSVGENVAFGLRERRVSLHERIKAAREALDLVRLAGYENRRIQGLSGGEQQRIALARAIVNQPEVLLLDEPLGALDLKLRRAMQEELKSIQQRLGMTFLYVTHDQEEALLMSDRIGIMRSGKLEQIGTPEELYDRPVTAFVADFVGEANCLPATVTEVRRDGAAVVRLTSGQHVEAMCNHARAGAAGALILRPERVELTAGSTRVAATLSGIVKNVYFVGTFRRFIVDIGAATTIVVASSNTEVAPPPGSQVALTFKPEQAWFLAEKPPLSEHEQSAAVGVGRAPENNDERGVRMGAAGRNSVI